MLAPVLIGQYLSLVYYRRQCRAWDEVVPAVLIGRTLTEAEAAEAVKQGVTAVLDLTAEFSEAAAFRDDDVSQPSHPRSDSSDAGPIARGGRIHRRRSGERHGVRALQDRLLASAAVVGAYLLASGQAATIDEAVEILREARPSIVIRPEVMEALRAFANCEHSPNLPLEENAIRE